MAYRKYGDYLKSDFVQLAHHGQGEELFRPDQADGGSTIEFYKADGTKVITVQDSMESYTARKAAVYPLAEKMLAFSDSAYKYLHRNDK